MSILHISLRGTLMQIQITILFYRREMYLHNDWSACLQCTFDVICCFRTTLNISRRFTTVCIDKRLQKWNHSQKSFQDFRQSCVLSTYRIEIYQSQPLVWPSDLLYLILVGCDLWISILSGDNMYDWRKSCERFRWCFDRKIVTHRMDNVLYFDRKFIFLLFPVIQHSYCRHRRWISNIASKFKNSTTANLRYRHV